MKKNHIFSIFNRFGVFPQIFGQINEWPVLELHEMVRVPHLVACQIVFIWFYE